MTPFLEKVNDKVPVAFPSSQQRHLNLTLAWPGLDWWNLHSAAGALVAMFVSIQLRLSALPECSLE